MNKKFNLTRSSHKHRKLVIFLALSLLQLGLLSNVAGETRQEQLEKIYEAAIGKDEAIIGTAMAIVQENNVLFSKASGLANLEHRVPVDNKTLFHWASVSKQFTGIAIATLIGEGKVSLNDRIHKYVPKLPEF